MPFAPPSEQRTVVMKRIIDEEDEEKKKEKAKAVEVKAQKNRQAVTARATPGALPINLPALSASTASPEDQKEAARAARRRLMTNRSAMCEACSGGERPPTEQCTPQCHQQRRRWRLHNFNSQYTSVSDRTMHSSPMITPQRRTVRRIRSEAIRDLKMEMKQGNQDGSPRKKMTMEADNLENALRAIRSPETTSSELIQKMLESLRIHLMNGGTLSNIDSFWSQDFPRTLSTHTDVCCHILILVDVIPIDACGPLAHSIIAIVLTRIKQKTVPASEKEDENDHDISNLLPALTSLLWIVKKSQKTSINDAIDNWWGNVTSKIPSLLERTMPIAMEPSCRCFLALQTADSAKEPLLLSRPCIQQLVAELKFPKENTVWPLHVLNVVIGSLQTDNANDNMWKEVTARVSAILLDDNPISLLLRPACHVLCQVLPRSIDSTDTDTLKQLVAFCCTIIQDQDEHVDTWEAVGRLSCSLCSIHGKLLAEVESQETLATIQTALLDTLECLMDYSSSYVVVVAHAMWTLASQEGVVVDPRALPLLSEAADLCRGGTNHRNIVLAVVGLCSSETATAKDQIPIAILGDSLADHPNDAVLAETTLNVLANNLRDDVDLIDRVLRRHNVVEACANTGPNADAPLIHILTKLVNDDFSSSPTGRSLRNHAVRRVAASGNLALAAELLTCMEPSAVLLNRIVERIPTEPVLACQTLLQIMTNYPTHFVLPVESIAEGLLDIASASPEVHVWVCQMVWMVVASTPAAVELLLPHVFDIIGLYYKEESIYQPDVLHAAAGALAAAAAHNKGGWDVKEVAMVAETAYKVLESEDESKLEGSALEAVVNYFVFLSIASEASIDVMYRSGMILLVVDVLDSLPNYESLQEIGCCIMERFTETQTMNMYLVVSESGGVKEVTQALKRFPNNRNIRMSVTNSLSRLCGVSALESDVNEAGCFSVILTTMKANVEDLDLCLNTAKIISNLSIPKSQAEPLLTAFRLAMVASPLSLDLHRICLKYLAKLYNDDLIDCSMNGWTDVLNKAMTNFCGVVSIVDPTLTIIAHILGNGKCDVAAIDAQTLASATLSVIENPAAQKNGFQCLALTQRSLEASALVLQTISLGMRTHFDSLLVQEEACHAMSMVLAEHNSNATCCHVGAVIDSMRRFPLSQKLQHHGCMALCAFPSELSRESQDELISVLITAADNFPEDCGRLAERALSS